MIDIPTIKVKHKEYKYEMVINEDDFDPKVHEKIGEKATTSKKKEEVVPPNDENTSDEELKKLMGE